MPLPSLCSQRDPPEPRVHTEPHSHCETLNEFRGFFWFFFSFEEGDAHTADPDPGKKWNPTNFFRTCMSEYSFMPYHDAWSCSYLRTKPFPTLCCFSGQAVYSYWWSLKRRVGEWKQAAHWRVSLPCLGLGLCPPAGPVPCCCSPKL